MKRRFLAMLTLLAGLMLPWQNAAGTDEITKQDRVAIRAVVQAQLEALAADDADTAFALTTADTRSKLGDPATFLQIIKEQFQPIYHHRRAIFSMPEIMAGRILQVVRLTDGDSSVWLAAFLMQKDQDGNWKVDDCKLFETSSVSI
jgi:hypothetical protein